jgi:hypothetical protein
MHWSSVREVMVVLISVSVCYISKKTYVIYYLSSFVKKNHLFGSQLCHFDIL